MPLEDTIRKNKYDREHYKRLGLKINIDTDNDILEWLKQQPSIQGSIKRLIREDITRCREQA